jgi:hypothetical protein
LIAVDGTSIINTFLQVALVLAPSPEQEKAILPGES